MLATCCYFDDVVTFCSIGYSILSLPCRRVNDYSMGSLYCARLGLSVDPGALLNVQFSRSKANASNNRGSLVWPPSLMAIYGEWTGNSSLSPLAKDTSQVDTLVMVVHLVLRLVGWLVLRSPKIRYTCWTCVRQAIGHPWPSVWYFPRYYDTQSALLQLVLASILIG